MKLGIAVVSVTLAGAAFAAATGRIEGPDGKPIAGAQVCEQLQGAPERCVAADSKGFYRLESPVRTLLIVRAKGFVAQGIQAVPLDTPVKLQRAATLLVSVVDAATGVPLASGKVNIDSPSGLRIGDFVPFNKAGVRISTLAPGDVFVRVQADGYQPSGPVPVTLQPGVERSVTVRMKKASGSPPH